MKRRYRRYFIMLELEDKNYKAYENKEVKGHAKVEIKNGEGTLSIHCQNLKNSSNNRYRWYLINTNTEGVPTVVEVGPMEVDERGKGEIVCGFNTENVKGSKEQIDNFNVLVLSVQNKEDKGKLHTPLVGYTEKERPSASSWKYALSRYLYIPVEDEGPVKEDLGVVAGNQLIENAIEDSIPESKAIAADEPEAMAADESKDILASEPKDAGANELKYGAANEPQDETSKEEDNEYEEQMQAYVENSLKGFSKTQPFIEDFNDYTWWQIPYNDQTMYRAYMPFILYLDSLKDSTSPYVSKILEKISLYSHHIFGIYYDENNKAKHYVYGIPSKNIPIEGLFETTIDFAKWHPCNNVPVNIESQGYFILTIDPKTGDVS